MLKWIPLSSFHYMGWSPDSLAQHLRLFTVWIYIILSSPILQYYSIFTLHISYNFPNIPTCIPLGFSTWSFLCLEYPSTHFQIDKLLPIHLNQPSTIASVWLWCVNILYLLSLLLSCSTSYIHLLKDYHHPRDPHIYSHLIHAKGDVTRGKDCFQ